MNSLHSNPAHNSDEQRRTARVTDAVVAGYIRAISRQGRAVNSVAAPHAGPGPAGDGGHASAAGPDPAGDRGHTSASGARHPRSRSLSRHHPRQRAARAGSPATRGVRDRQRPRQPAAHMG